MLLIVFIIMLFNLTHYRRVFPADQSYLGYTEFIPDVFVLTKKDYVHVET